MNQAVYFETTAKVVRVQAYMEGPHGFPEYAHLFDSGMDVKAWIADKQPLTINPGCVEMIHTGLYVAIPPGLELQVRPRSGMGRKFRVSVINTPGTIDSPYRGECCVLLENRGAEPFVVNDGDAIAQFVLAPVFICEWNPVESKDKLPATPRGEGGFGSTGVRAGEGYAALKHD